VNWYRDLRLSPEQIGRVQDWFRRAGRWVLAFGYFVPGVRLVTAYVAGVSGLPFLDYAVFAYTGGLFWSLILIGIGYFLGEGWGCSQMPLQHDLGILVGIALVGILL
jgi:membrane protein DedA with SNARE-associated domain